METSVIFNAANLWLSSPWKATRHGDKLTSPLGDMMQQSYDPAERAEAKRLYHKVFDTMHRVRERSKFPITMPTVAFMPTGQYDDESGIAIIPKDTIHYPEGCTLEERNRLQMAEAEKCLMAYADIFGIKTEESSNAVTEQPDNAEVEAVAESVSTEETPEEAKPEAEETPQSEVVETPQVEQPKRRRYLNKHLS